MASSSSVVAMPTARTGRLTDVSRRAFLCAGLVLLCFSAWSSGSLPPEVQRFVERRDICDHLRREVESPASVAKANRACKGTDRQLQQLRAKYRLQANVIELLKVYEARVESR